MKFHIEVECTPEEARRLFGLPDMEPLHDAYLDKARELMAGGVTPDTIEKMVKNWMPMGEAGLDLVQSLFGGIAGQAHRTAAKGSGDKKDSGGSDASSGRGRRG